MSKSAKPVDTCEQPGAGSLAADSAREIICRTVIPVNTTVIKSIDQVLHHVLAQDVVSKVKVPGYTNSAVDGYAFHSQSLASVQMQSKLTLTGTLLAGKIPQRALAKGECLRIMTGAILPAGADAVLMQEYASLEDNQLCSDNWPESGANVRQAGEDLSIGQTALGKGSLLSAADIGLLASLGITEVTIFRPLKVAVLSTGDEVKAIDTELNAGEVYDSNRYTLRALLGDSQCQVREMGIIPDNYDSLHQALHEAADFADIVISSAGVSVGEADFTRQVLDDIGAVDFWKLAIKPGRPLAFGCIGDTVFFGLPGNPVAVMVTFMQFVLPAIKKMQGLNAYQALRLRATSESAINKKTGRTEYCRAIFSSHAESGLQVKTTGSQGSGVLSSMSKANCFITLPPQQGRVAIGDEVTIEPFSGFF